MESKQVKIDGEIYDLSDPAGKKAAVRAWLRARSRERGEQVSAVTSEHTAPPATGSDQEKLPVDDG